MPLKKVLQKRHIDMIAIGGIIGSSYFIGTGYVVNQMGPSACLAYALGGLITFLTMACFTELILAKKVEGSFINYAKTYISSAVGAAVGWCYFISWIVYVPSECIAGGILLHHFFPLISVPFYALFLGLLIACINLKAVKAFGEMEYILSIIKLSIIALFSIIGILIFFGLIGNQKEFIGTRYLGENGGFFAKGLFIFLSNLVIMISSFQGTEIIGITASESKNPEETVPRSLKQITWRLLYIYFIPTLIIVSIFPWQDASLKRSVFSEVLLKYGFSNIAQAFGVLIIAGSISCSSSGLYSTIRSLYSLSATNLAPKTIQKLSKSGVPINASLITIAFVLLVISLSFFIDPDSLYTNLLALTGFGGSICWITICFSQYYFRKKHNQCKQEKKPLIYKMPFYPSLTMTAIGLQIFALVVLYLSKDLRFSFYFGIPTFVLPFLIYKYYLKKKRPF